MRRYESEFDEFDDFFDFGVSDVRHNRYLMNKKFREEMRPKRHKHAGPSSKIGWEDNEWSDFEAGDFLDADYSDYDADEFDFHSGMSLEEH